jgi:hypothetical protein
MAETPGRRQDNTGLAEESYGWAGAENTVPENAACCAENSAAVAHVPISASDGRRNGADSSVSDCRATIFVQKTVGEEARGGAAT